MTSSNPESSLSGALPDAKTVERMAASAHEAIDRVAAKAGPAADKVNQMAGEAVDAAKLKADEFGELPQEWADAVRGFVREKPLTSLAIGVAAGVLLARLTR